MNADDPIATLRREAAGDQDALVVLWYRYRERLKRLVRLRLYHRLHGRLYPSDVLRAFTPDSRTLAASETEGDSPALGDSPMGHGPSTPEGLLSA